MERTNAHTHIPTCTHICIRTCAYAHTHSQVHIYSTHAYTCTLAHTHACLRTCMHTYAYTCTHTHTHTHAQMCIHTHTHTCANTCRCTHTYTIQCTQFNAHIPYTYRCTHTCSAYTYIHMHTCRPDFHYLSCKLGQYRHAYYQKTCCSLSPTCTSEIHELTTPLSIFNLDHKTCGIC